MADLDIEQLLNLAKTKIFLDLSKVFPARLFSYLVAFLPGFFFAVSILLASPELAGRLAGRVATQGIPIVGRYFTMAVVLILTFAVGYAFMLVDAFIQYVFGYWYRIRNFCWRELCRWPLGPLTNRLLKKPFWNRRPWIMTFNRYVISTGYLGSDEWNRLWRLWVVCARRLVKVRYGIDPADLSDRDWEVLYWTLAFTGSEETRGDVLMIAIHAMGWAGLFAIRIVPALKTPYYLIFCIFLIINGLLHDYYVVKRSVEPRASGILTVRAILKALREDARKNTEPAPTE